MSAGRGGRNKLLRNKRTETQKRNAAARPGITERNRKRRQKKHLSFHPRDRQTLAALKKLL